MSIATTNKNINIVWFKRDLRINDHAPLFDASMQNLPLLPLYVVEPNYWEMEFSSRRHWYFIHDCLSSLNAELSNLGQPLIVQVGDVIERLKKIQLDLHKDFIELVEKSRGTKLKKTEVELFSGEFWSGTKAKDLGLIDGIGDAQQILREKFGEDIVIKTFEKTKSWLSKKLSSSSDHVDQIANILDEKSVWQKYGL